MQRTMPTIKKNVSTPLDGASKLRYVKYLIILAKQTTKRPTAAGIRNNFIPVPPIK